MRHGSLFSGIGGFDLAAQWMGWQNIFSCEIDKFCNAVTKKHFPDCIQHEDIRTTDFTIYRGRIDVLSGGPPCQPASIAGKRKGESDNRWLWPEAIRVFGEVMPGVGVFENPDDLLTLDDGRPFERICSSLEGFGYQVETYGISAACVGAWHRRDRIWIVAYSGSFGRNDGGDHRKERQVQNDIGVTQEIQSKRKGRQRGAGEIGTTDAYPNLSRLQRPTRSRLRIFSETQESPAGSSAYGTPAEIGKYWATEPGVGRMVHGVSNRVDRIKSLGNAIVPQVAFQIFKAIEASDLQSPFYTSLE